MYVRKLIMMTIMGFVVCVFSILETYKEEVLKNNLFKFGHPKDTHFTINIVVW